jgi:hypothetical protein
MAGHHGGVRCYQASGLGFNSPVRQTGLGSSKGYYSHMFWSDLLMRCKGFDKKGCVGGWRMFGSHVKLPKGWI